MQIQAQYQVKLKSLQVNILVAFIPYHVAQTPLRAYMTLVFADA
jgi:hypothetical protein